MRVCSHSVIAPEWTSTESGAKLMVKIESLLPMLSDVAVFSKVKSQFNFEIKLAKTIGANKAQKLELELMQLQGCPFVTVIRINQKVRLK